MVRVSTGNKKATIKDSIGKQGFTLIELMIGLIIMGLIAGGTYFAISSYLESARETSTKTKLQNLQVILMNYKNNKGEYPERLTDLVKTGVVKTLPDDGWNRPFVYRRTPEGTQPYELYSYGSQGKGGAKKTHIYAD